MKTKPIITAFVFSAVVSFSALAEAGTLENLERERALTINTMLNPEIAIKDRQAKIASAKVRLIDLERMVLRDKKLTGRNTPTVRQAFENYDLTFLVHGATEKNISIVDAWLNQLGMTTQSVLSASLRRR
tara:strand:- start:293 stop:682 length:390 start_codon:yes stop_codon:yes gene_type:complete